MQRVARTSHPYRNAALREPHESHEHGFDQALFAVHAFLRAWSFLRIVFDVSCARLDVEGVAAVILCVALTPSIMQRWEKDRAAIYS